MAEFIGQLISSVPSWLFLPILIVVIALITAIWWIWSTVYASSYGASAWPFKSRRIYLGEKKHGKK